MAPLVVIVGETASGKSELALELAEKFNGEIICADSWTVRREVNIGTAKPTAQDLKRVRHHLLDVVDPCADFTAAVFKGLALKAIDDISKRGKLPILVGGTGLYIDGVIYNFNFLPSGDRKAREKLDVMSVSNLVQLAHKMGLDTKEIDIKNKRRIIRLIETKGAQPKRQELRPNTLILGLTIPREGLKRRIIERTDSMLERGLEDEVRNLSEKYGWECEALKGIGYSQWREYFENHKTLEETRQKIINDTANLAKRQRTWFKRNKSIHYLNYPSEAVEILTTFLNKSMI
ncbi:MAG TPA: tRNA (adenosine(37)-N6)-dimethylallyltransferase MiaA [Patescibacteria group bacterium]|nr:tRNA (adenosine(37)-N6)-dimethylallyltransferase MiaA [Patescibacteria group bacterium]